MSGAAARLSWSQIDRRVMRSRLCRREGFTLIELLIVIIIIGILSSIAIPLYMGQRDRAKGAAVKEGVHNVEIGIQTYAIEHQDSFPAVTDVTRGGPVGATVENWPLNPWTDADMADTTSSAQGDFHYVPSSGTYTLVGYGSTGVVIAVP
jgi:prepilin-type N-terminal cleavage/methylation domain-containing protein